MWGAIWLSEAQSELDVSHSHNAKQTPLLGGVRAARKLRVEQFQARTTRHGWRGWKPSHGRRSLLSLEGRGGKSEITQNFAFSLLRG